METTQSSHHMSTPARFRSLMASFPSGVSIVTAVGDGQAPWGMTCSAVCSVAVDPPTLLVGMRVESPTLAAAVHSGVFAVNLLHARARGYAELFASADPHRFGAIRWHRPEGGGGPHLVDAAHTVADCRITRTVRVAGQRIVFGEVFRITELSDTKPLLYGFRGYASWPAADAESEGEGREAGASRST
ncbi:flavin reductase family protein [Streptomyces gibsoniae]|uniref:Flavin reductase family protein n=1 Tax=Streptomyces gibsoniae TaxID=3075529 RepID=A0ABU2TU31_9ACTN|nr:flavin reductase family protein [Streptomyces sp. DSM 41699]MDT0464468.1 flavin reductase family protein [Streptomyces sp. DSM 41699]